MPKYTSDIIAGYTLYFTSKCVVEAMHVHASQDNRLREVGSAKFFVSADGSSKMMAQGTLKAHQVLEIQAFIKQHHLEMFAKWSERSKMGFFAS